jgi:hypothetical protein
MIARGVPLARHIRHVAAGSIDGFKIQIETIQAFCYNL